MDYVTVNRELSIQPQQTLLSFPVSIINDQKVETGDKRFKLHLKGLGSTCVVTGSAATVTIKDDDKPSVVTPPGKIGNIII